VFETVSWEPGDSCRLVCHKLLVDSLPSKSSSSSWKQFYIDCTSKKEEKYAEIAARYKMATQAAVKEKKELGVKTINMATAVRIEASRKPIALKSSSFIKPLSSAAATASSSAGMARSSSGAIPTRPSSASQPSKLSQLKKHANAVSNLQYALKKK
jgi:hypothetical protein